jgi:hypothetical protein
VNWSLWEAEIILLDYCMMKMNPFEWMLHSGSRYIGKTTAEYHHKIDQAQCGKLLSKGNFPPADLATLEIDSPQGQEYLNDMLWCQQYAHLNREVMLNRLIETVINTNQIIRRDHFCEKPVCSYLDLDTKTGKIVEKKRKGHLISFE